MSRNAAQWAAATEVSALAFRRFAHLHRRGDLRGGAGEDLQHVLDHRLPRVRAPGAFDYRTFTHPGGAPLIIVRGDDLRVRSVLQRLPASRQHAALRPGRATRSASPASSTSGRSTPRAIASTSRREEQGFQKRFCKADAGLREVRTEIGFGGFVWVNLDDDAPHAQGVHRRRARHARGVHVDAARGVPLPQGDRPHQLTSCGTTPTASSITTICTTSIASPGMMQPGYFDRKYTGYPNGHASVGSMTIKYDAYEGSKERGVGWPGLAPGGWILIDIFPAMTYNLRTSVLRMDTVDTARARQAADRVSRPRPEERHAGAACASACATTTRSGGRSAATCTRTCSAVHGQGRAMRPGSEASWVLHGREENMTIHDEGRHAALLRRMEQADGAAGVRPVRRPAGRDGRERRLSERSGSMTTTRAATESRSRSSSIARASRSTRRTSRATSICATTSFRYTITAYSPEIRKDMIWLDHDKAGMQLLFGNLPRHNSDHSPLTRHATVYTVDVDAGGHEAARGFGAAGVPDRRSTAARPSSSRSDATSTRSSSTARRRGSRKRVVRLETRQFGFGYHIPF